MNTVNFKYNNGDVLRDKVTGFTGVVMVCAAYATGCHHYGLQDQNLKDGAPAEWQWLDVSRLEVVKYRAVQFTQVENLSGGPSPKGPQV